MENSLLEKQKKTLSLFQFIMMIFIMTCSGPYGIESVVEAGGVGYTLLGLTLTPIFYSLPQSLMSAELSSMMPSNHGYIAWVYRGFDNFKFWKFDSRKLGDFIGFMNSINVVAGTGFDVPIYAVLLYDYLETGFSYFGWKDDFTSLQKYLIKLAVVLIGGIINIFNIDIVGSASVLFTVIIFAPFTVGFFWSIPDQHPGRWVAGTYDGYHWGLFLSTVLWLNTGFDIMGCLAGEIGFSKKKFFLAFGIGMIMDWSAYVLTIIGATAVTPKSPSNKDDYWYDGYLLEAYDNILGGLGYSILAAGLVSNFALYVVELSAHARSLWAISQPYILVLPNGKMVMENDIEEVDEESKEIIKTKHDEIRKIPINILPQSFLGTVWKRSGAPINAVIFQTLISCFLIRFEFSSLVEAVMLVSCFGYLLEFMAFMRLKYTEPDAPRPCVVPGGMFGAWLTTIVKMIVVGVVIVSTLIEEPYIFLICIAYNSVLVLWYIIRNWYHARRGIDYFGKADPSKLNKFAKPNKANYSTMVTTHSPSQSFAVAFAANTEDDDNDATMDNHKNTLNATPTGEI